MKSFDAKDYSDSGSESDSGSDDASMDSEGTNNWLGQSLSQSQRINRVSQNSSNKVLIEVNSNAVAMDVARPYGFEINFVRNPISGSAA